VARDRRWQNLAKPRPPLPPGRQEDEGHTTTMFSSTADGILAALLSPLFMTIGFFVWDARWTGSGGSAFALNS
jgi:hypothetical protein